MKSQMNTQPDTQLVTEVMGLFDSKPRPPRLSSNHALYDARTMLDVEFTIKPYEYTFTNYLFSIEMRIGHKRLYVVQHLRELLTRIDNREVYVFSKTFTYDPYVHRFDQDNDAVIAQLIQIYHDEYMYAEVSNAYSRRPNHKKDERVLLIPPSAWEDLLPLLVKAGSVLLECGNRSYSGIQLSEDLLPLQFEFDRDENEGYQLAVQGLDDFVIMESYGIVLYEGKLIKLSSDQCTRLLSLRKLLDATYTDVIPIPQEQMERFMEKVMPGLKRLGHVYLSEAVSTRIVQPSLKAKLYLDRVKNKLLAGLEFQYGDIILDPFEEENRKRGTDLILMRDSELEEQIVALMEQGAFVKTEGGYFLDDEAAEYNFLCHIIPQLEKLLKVFATTAVKARIHKGNIHPRVTVKMDERTDWLDFHFDMDGIHESEIRNLLRSVEEKRKYYRLPSGALVPIEQEELQEMVRFMNELGVHSVDILEAGIRLPIARGLHLLDSERYGSTIRLGKSFRMLLNDIQNPDHMDFPIPDSMSLMLRDYQKYGFQWMKTLAHYHFGGILADDMGLGKTIQSIAYIVSELTEIRRQKLPVLIVCPASLIYNWYNELKKFAPLVKAVIADGNRTERLSAWKLVSQIDVMITSYPLLRSDIERYSQQEFHTLLLDEAQAFKNYTTQTAQAVKQIKARHRFALTGTPIENSIEELWSIFDVVFPELFLGRKTFIELPRDDVVKRIRPFLLRRLKSDVLQELPEKIESLQASKMLPDQKKLYVTYLAKLQQDTLKHLNDNDFQSNRIRILAGLTRLRQICCHPALFVEGYNGSSAKFEQLLDIIEECRSAGKRLLIFSQFTKMLALISKELGLQGVPFFYLDGHTPPSERVELSDKFNDGERDIFLISLKAGGTGLNLTGADTVILYDLWWNPAVEQQATDRAHRIGQKNVVQVIRLVTQGTVEDRMYELQQAKKDLIEEVIQPGQEALSTLTEQDIRHILMI